MGTLQQELTKLTTLDNLAFDDDPTPPPTQELMNTPTAPTEKPKRQLYWEYIRDHEGTTTRQMADAFGMDQTQLATVVTKLLNKGIIDRWKDTAGAYQYRVCVNEYPITTMEQKVSAMVAGRRAQRLKARRKHAPEKSPKPTLEEKKAAFYNAAPTAPLPPNMRFTASVPELLNALSITQARALYDELKKIFGG